VLLRGKPLPRRSPNVCLVNGLGMVPENRKTQGNITDLSVAQNITIGILDKLSGAAGLLRPSRMRSSAAELIGKMRVQPPGSGPMTIQQLSGGNQQKVIVARWLAAGPKVFIFDEPTQGIDVGTKAQIYRLLTDLKQKGHGIILISSELIELTELADRVLVVRHGRIVDRLSADGLDEDELFTACAVQAELPARVN